MTKRVREIERAWVGITRKKKEMGTLRYGKRVSYIHT